MVRGGEGRGMRGGDKSKTTNQNCRVQVSAAAVTHDDSRTAMSPEVRGADVSINMYQPREEH